MNGPTIPLTPLQQSLARMVLFRADKGAQHLPTLKELAKRYGVSQAAIREALVPVHMHGLVELRAGKSPWLPPLVMRRGIETIGLELEVARTRRERRQPLRSWLDMEHELIVESFRRCAAYGSYEMREDAARAVDQVVSAAFSDAPVEALALYRWRAIKAAVAGAQCEALRLLSLTLGRSAERILPYISVAIHPEELAEEMIEVQDLLRRRQHDDLASFLAHHSQRLHAEVLDIASPTRTGSQRRRVHLFVPLRRVG